MSVFLKPCKDQGKAQMQSPTTSNYAVKFPTFGEIKEVSKSGVQWISHALGKSPSWSWYLPCQVSMKLITLRGKKKMYGSKRGRMQMAKKEKSQITLRTFATVLPWNSLFQSCPEFAFSDLIQLTILFYSLGIIFPVIALPQCLWLYYLVLPSPG